MKQRRLRNCMMGLILQIKFKMIRKKSGSVVFDEKLDSTQKMMHAFFGKGHLKKIQIKFSI